MQALSMSLTAGVALASLCGPAHAVTIYTSLTDWQAALSNYNITTDPFSNTIASAQSITLDSGIISTNSGPAMLPNNFNNNSVTATGVYSNAVQAGAGTASNMITWMLPPPKPVIGFAGDFLSVNAGRLSLSGDFDGTGTTTIQVYEALGGANGFLGVIGMAPFTRVTFGNPSETVDGFAIDQAYFAPVPGPLPVLGASAAFGWSRRLRRRIALLGRRGSLDTTTKA